MFYWLVTQRRGSWFSWGAGFPLGGSQFPLVRGSARDDAERGWRWVCFILVCFIHVLSADPHALQSAQLSVQTLPALALAWKRASVSSFGPPIAPSVLHSWVLSRSMDGFLAPRVGECPNVPGALMCCRCEYRYCRCESIYLCICSGQCDQEAAWSQGRMLSCVQRLQSKKIPAWAGQAEHVLAQPCSSQGDPSSINSWERVLSTHEGFQDFFYLLSYWIRRKNWISLLFKRLFSICKP